MHAFWLRWRNGTQTSAHASQTNNPDDSPSLTDQGTPDALSTSTPASVVDRPIVPDIASLLETYSTEYHPPHGLKPPRRTKGDLRTICSVHLADSSVPRTESAHQVAEVPSPNIKLSQRPETLQEDVSSLSSSKRRFSRLSGQLTAVSPWATFGKNEERKPSVSAQTAPPSAWHSGSFDSLVPRRSSSSKRRKVQSKPGSVTSLHRFTNPSLASSDVLPSRSIISTSARSSFSKLNDDEDHDDDQFNAFSSLQQSSSPDVSNTSRLQLTRSSHSTRSQSAGTPSLGTRSMIFGSPYTFGNPSPSTRSRNLHHQSESASPPPPLPPLDHPELLSALASRSRISVSKTQNDKSYHLRTSRYPKWVTGLHATTYPVHRRHKTVGEARKHSRAPFESSVALGPSLRRYSSLPVPKMQRIFRTSSAERQDSDRLQRPRTKSGRRTSAEWCAEQATAGVTSLLPSDFGWPAEVAHHLVKLSLGREAGIAEQIARGRPGNAEPRVPQAASQSDPQCPCYPSRSIPALLDSLSPQLLPAQQAADSQGGRDRLHVMHTPGEIKLQNISKDDSDVPKSDLRKDTLRRSASASARTDTLGKARSKRAFHKSTPSPVASTSKPLEAGPSSSPYSSILNTSLSSKSGSFNRPPRSASEPGLMSVPETPPNSKGKRKAEELDITPPDQKNAQRATFVIPPEGRRSHRTSEVSRAPSSYHNKRVRLSASSQAPSPGHSRPGSAQKAPASSSHTASWPSRTGGPPHALFRSGSRTASLGSAHGAESVADRRTDRRRSISELSIPISALIAPHAPSVARSSTYHMRDPRKPPKIQPTDWVPRVRTEDQEGSPTHAWFFFIGFILFPLWWVVSFSPIPKTRHVGGTDTEKAVTLDDPQVEHDARTWRNRCRVMAAISFLTYIPFIILLAIFVPRHT